MVAWHLTVIPLPSLHTDYLQGRLPSGITHHDEEFHYHQIECCTHVVRLQVSKVQQAGHDVRLYPASVCHT